MQTLFGWALVIGVFLRLVGADAEFAQLAVIILTIVLIVAGILIMVGLKRPGQVLVPVLCAALALALIPSLIAAIIHEAWNSLSPPALLLAAAAIAVIALIVSREKR